MTEPEPRSEAWAASADPAPEAEPTAEPADDTDDVLDMEHVRKLRQENHSLRSRLRDTEEQLGQASARLSAHELRTIEQAAKAAGFYDPSDFIAAHGDVSDLRDEFLDVMPDRVAEAARAVLDAKPYLGRPVGAPPTDRPIEGLRGGARPEEPKTAPSWFSALRGG